mmetsp:Transcript_8527/g.21307  ORF Transcript_8527/g.21307 Transcript_8527/m.21307 type:complete len:344 (-) Transcript_8527:156-1187(-)
MPVLGRRVQRRVLIVIARVGVPPSAHKGLNRGHVPPARSVVHRAQAKPVLAQHVCASLQHVLDDVRLPVSSSAVEAHCLLRARGTFQGAEVAGARRALLGRCCRLVWHGSADALLPLPDRIPRARFVLLALPLLRGGLAAVAPLVQRRQEGPAVGSLVHLTVQQVVVLPSLLPHLVRALHCADCGPLPARGTGLLAVPEGHVLGPRVELPPHVVPIKHLRHGLGPARLRPQPQRGSRRLEGGGLGFRLRLGVGLRGDGQVRHPEAAGPPEGAASPPKPEEVLARCGGEGDCILPRNRQPRARARSAGQGGGGGLPRGALERRLLDQGDGRLARGHARGGDKAG